MQHQSDSDDDTSSTGRPEDSINWFEDDELVILVEAYLIHANKPVHESEIVKAINKLGELRLGAILLQGVLDEELVFGLEDGELIYMNRKRCEAYHRKARLTEQYGDGKEIKDKLAQLRQVYRNRHFQWKLTPTGKTKRALKKAMVNLKQEINNTETLLDQIYGRPDRSSETGDGGNDQLQSAGPGVVE